MEATSTFVKINNANGKTMAYLNAVKIPHLSNGTGVIVLNSTDPDFFRAGCRQNGMPAEDIEKLDLTTIVMPASFAAELLTLSINL